MKKVIELRNVSKQFDGETVLDSINLDIYDNEFLTLLGPSGCGKTTTLRMIGGFETPDQGDILFLGERINDIPPHKRNINTVFQRYALFPHLNVFENVAFPLREQKLPRNEIEQKVNEMLALVKLTGFERRNVTRLSGGQQQRVAIARALVSRPRVLLLDEPLAALDLKLRKDMQQELKNIQKATGITFVFVTHDQEEALSMSDTIVVMSEGKIQQIGTPLDIYNEPQNAFVADFIGESNILNGTMVRDNVVKMYGKEFPCVDGGFAPNEPVDVVIRPEDIEMQVYRSSGAGGQHINKTSSAVRLIHKPTGIVVSCQTQRSQFQNRDYAMEMLKAKLYQIAKQQHMDKIDDIKGVQNEIAWGHQIRSYVFMPYTMVKDHRTNYETGNVDAVMDGDIDEFIFAYLKAASRGELQDA